MSRTPRMPRLPPMRCTRAHRFIYHAAGLPGTPPAPFRTLCTLMHASNLVHNTPLHTQHATGTPGSPQLEHISDDRGQGFLRLSGQSNQPEIPACADTPHVKADRSAAAEFMGLKHDFAVFATPRAGVVYQKYHEMLKLLGEADIKGFEAWAAAVGNKSDGNPFYTGLCRVAGRSVGRSDGKVVLFQPRWIGSYSP